MNSIKEMNNKLKKLKLEHNNTSNKLKVIDKEIEELEEKIKEYSKSNGIQRLEFLLESYSDQDINVVFNTILNIFKDQQADIDSLKEFDSIHNNNLNVNNIVQGVDPIKGSKNNGFIWPNSTT